MSKLAVLGLLLLGGLLAATPALRHTELSESFPEADAELAGPVTEIVLTFTTSVAAPVSSISVTGPDGMVETTGPVQHPPDREDQIRVRFPARLSPGAYEVDWSALAPDGHVVEGTFAFSVAGPPPVPDSATTREAAQSQVEEGEVGPEAPAEPDATAGGPTLPAGTGTRWIQLLGSILVLGVAGVRFAVLPGLGRGTPVEVRSRIRGGIRRSGWVGAGLLLVSLPFVLSRQLASIGDAGFDEASFVLFETAWGGGWFLYLLAAGLAAFGLALAGRGGGRDRGWAVVGVAALLLPLAAGLQGHAWGSEGVRGLAVLSLYLHVLGAGAWLGGLLLLVVVGLPAAKAGSAAVTTEQEEPAGRPTIARLVNAFSRIAVLAVAVVVVSGIVNAWIHLGGLAPLFGSAYGRTLLLKLAAVAAALLLGFYNWRRVRPSLAGRPDASALRIPASVEAVLGVVVLLVTAALVATPTP